MNPKSLLIFTSLFVLLSVAIPESADAQADKVVVWKSQNGATFQVRHRQKKQDGTWVLSILEGKNFGTITIRKNIAVKVINLDLSRFRVEGNAPRSIEVVGSYANDQFTFGNEVYRRMPPQ